MKKILALTLALVLTLSLAACAQTDGHDHTESTTAQIPFVAGAFSSDMEDIFVRLNGIYTDNGETDLVVTWFNESEFSVTGGDVYDIQRLENGDWVSCALQDSTATPVVLSPGKITNKRYEITDLYDLTIPGAYRYLTSCQVSQGNGMQKECNMWAQFEIN